MPVTIDINTLKSQLSKYLIDEVNFPNIPASLKGEILLEEVKDELGNVKGWITVKPDALLQIILQRDNPSMRPSELQGLSINEYLTQTGWKKYLDNWNKEGIKL
jgi:hypothetical protein